MRSINPFHFMLLKRMIEFEFTDTLRSVSREKIMAAIGEKVPSIETKKGTVTGGSFSSGNLRNRIWNTKNYKISEDGLDRMVKLVSKLGSYPSWEDFTRCHANNLGAELAAIHVNPNGTLPALIEKEISAMAEDRIGRMYERYRLINARDAQKYHLDENEEDVVSIRQASVSDIALIADLAKRVYKCPTNDFSIKKPWHDKNNRIFIVAVDEYGELIGNLNIIPLKLPFYRAMKAGEIYENSITPDDIHSVQEKNEVRCLYVEGYASLFASNQREFRRRFKYVVQGLADINNEEVIVCAIGGSICGENVMKKYGLETTGTAIDTEKLEYPFLEIKLKTLLNIIDGKIEDSENSIWTE